MSAYGSYISPERFGIPTGEIPAPVAFTPTAPLARQIVQRGLVSNTGSIPILGSSATGTQAFARAVVRNTFAGVTTDWQSIGISAGVVSGNLIATPGYYDVEIRITQNGFLISSATVSRVGVGDIIISAGQSLDSNYAKPLNTNVPTSDAVNATDESTWQHAIDPQPIADNTFSSVWPWAGDLLIAETGYPVGFITVGVGNTYIADWVPGQPNYNRIADAVSYFPPNGFLCFLWSQGENDASAGTSQVDYTADLEDIIDQLRIDAGWQVPCGIGIETHPNEVTGAGVRAAQIAVGSTYPDCFEGADLDTLGNSYRYDTVHFNTTTGTPAAANLWVQSIINYFGF